MTRHSGLSRPRPHRSTSSPEPRTRAMPTFNRCSRRLIGPTRDGPVLIGPAGTPAGAPEGEMAFQRATGSNPHGSTNCPLLHNAYPHNADWHYAVLRNGVR